MLRLSLLLVSFFSYTVLLAQSAYPGEGFGALTENRNLEAIELFSAFLEKHPGHADALLGRSLAHASLMDLDASEKDYHRYLDAEPDPERRNALREAFWFSAADLVSEAREKLLLNTTDNNYGRLRILALSSLGSHYRRLGEFEKSEKYLRQIGGVTDWDIVGAFENISESGFDADFGVLDHPEKDAVFTNKRGAAVTWFPAVVAADQTLRYTRHMITDDAIVYAQTFVTAPERREAIVRLGIGGSAKVWVNDELVFSQRDELGTRYDAFSFPIKLEAGNNRLLVQIGQTDRTTASFCLRVTGEDGRAMEDLRYSTEYRPYPKPRGWKASRLENPSEAYLKQQLAAGKNVAVNNWALQQTYIFDGRWNDARALLRQIASQRPDDIETLETLAVVYDNIDNETGASELRRRVRDLDSTAFSALSHRFEQAETNKDLHAFEAALEDHRKYFRDERTRLGFEMQLAGMKQNVPSIIALIEKGYGMYPEVAEMAIGKAMIMREVKSDPKKALGVLKEYDDNYYAKPVIDAIIEHYWNEKDTKKTLEYYERILRAEPQWPGYLLKMVDVYESSNMKDEAKATMNRIFELAPYVSNYRKQWADVLANRGQRESAAEQYAISIELNPYNYEARDALRKVESGGGTAFGVFPKVDYYNAFKAAGTAEDYPNDNSALVRYDLEQIIHPGGASETRTTLLVKVFDTDGVDNWKTYTIGLDNHENGFADLAEVIDPDGTRREASRDGAEVVFNGLKPGGGILLTYRTRDVQTGYLAGKWWQEHILTSALPSEHLSYRLLVPEGTDFNYGLSGTEAGDFSPQVTEVEGGKLYTWSSDGHPGETPEPVTRSWDELVATVHTSNITDWEFVANWYAKLTHAKIRPDDVVRETVAELFAGKQELDPRAEVELIYEFIVENIRYISVPFLQSSYVPQAAGKTLITRQGDCKDVSSLFVAMCAVRGIDANLVLVLNRDQNLSRLTIPGIGFNHCIGRVELDGKPYFVELTDDALAFGTGDASVNGAFALTIPRVGESFSGEVGPIDPPSRGVNAFRRNGTIELTDEGDAIFTLITRSYNNNAASLRRWLRYLPHEERERKLEESLNGEYPRITDVTLLSHTGLENRDSVASLEYSYRAADIAQRIAGLEIYEIKLADRLYSPDYLATETRQYPIDLWQQVYGEYQMQTIDVTSPPGKQLVETPENVTINNDYLSYRISFTPSETGVTIERTLNYKKDLVAPEDYAAFREDVRRIVETDEVSLAFR